MADASTGLLAAAFIGIVPGYISRSVAGSYDNEAIAIFLLMFTFYLWIKALKTGSAAYGTLAAMFYGWMVAAWGGYVFITNMIPLHVFVLVLMGRFNNRIYTAYSSWYVIGTLASMQVPFVGFLPVRTSEHMAALGEFFGIRVYGLPQSTKPLDLSSRCVWSYSTRRFRRDRTKIGTGQAIQIPAHLLRRRGIHCCLCRFGALDHKRMDRSLERKILFPLGHWVC
jgi:hypothetical protein